MSALQMCCSRAVNNLDQLQQNAENESVRMNSSRVILELALRAVELNDIQQRLDALEEIAQRKGQDHDRWPNDKPDVAASGHAGKANGRG
jgi:hypothetical protein